MIQYKKYFFIGLLVGTSCNLFAQTQVEYPGRPRYPDGMLGISLGAGPAKYLGEFLDGNVGTQYELQGQYSIFPEFAVGVHYALGNAKYERRVRLRGGALYNFQFGDTLPAMRSTDFNTFQVHLKINFFPRQFFNAYIFSGVGIMMYLPQDYLENRVKVLPQKEKFYSLTIPVGFGFEYFFQRNMAVYADFNMHIMFTDDFDAFPSGDLRDRYFKGSTSLTTEGNDGLITWNLGFRYFMFENDDLDGDLLTNEEEEALGTNPYDADTDGDRISDYDEVKVYHTDPLKIDTDGDGLTDYQEIFLYRTDPLKKDTDDDGISDADEVLVYKTNPLDPDTDHDGLPDAEEIRLGTDPLKADTDGDGLSDYEEVKIYHTDPLKADTDGDGLNDKQEITYKTDPLKADTDGDGLTDYEEVMIYHTNPLVVDTDGDGLSDYDEVKKLGTNPLNRDTDGDGIPDNLDKCPTVFGLPKFDGCPGEVPNEVAAMKTTMRIDTVVIREGATLTLFGVNFDNDKAVIRPESIPILEMNSQLFNKYPELVVEIRGHTDLKGSLEHNMNLSLRRAQSIEKYLQSLGIKSDRMIAKGFGPTKPVTTNNTEIGRARNRRIEFYILKVGSASDSLNITKPEQILIQPKGSELPKK